MPETTREQLQELARLDAEATQGEWATFSNRVYRRGVPGDPDARPFLMRGRGDAACWFEADADAEIVSAMRNALPALIADSRVLHDMIDERTAAAQLAELRTKLAGIAEVLEAARESHEAGSHVADHGMAAGIRLALKELAPLLQQAPPAGGAEG